MKDFSITGTLNRKGALVLYQEFRPVKKKQPKAVRFDRSAAWLFIRAAARMIYPNICVKCGSTDYVGMDHIKPKSQYHELALDIDNLQPLCWSCNKVKGVHNI